MLTAKVTALPGSAKVLPDSQSAIPMARRSASALPKHSIRLPSLMKNLLQKFPIKGINSFLKLNLFFLTLKASLKCVINFRLVKCVKHRTIFFPHVNKFRLLIVPAELGNPTHLKHEFPLKICFT